MTERVDVLVVGAGLAGLAAGATAARAGCDVMIVDSRVAGGRARSVERDGYVLNEGAHALYRSGPGAAVLRELGVPVTGGSPPIERYHTWWDGELHPLPLTATALVSTRLLGARSKVTAGRLLGRLERIARDLGPDDARITLGEWLERTGARPDLQKLLAVVVRLSSYSADPLGKPADAMLRQLALAAGGVDYIDGGWQRLVDGLQAAAAAAGARIVTGEAVSALERDGADWVATTAGRSVAAPSVVLAAGGPAVAEELVGRPVGWVDAAGPQLRAACLDVGVTERPPVSFLFSADDPLYLSEHAPTAALSPAGHHLFCLLRYLHVSERLDRDAARAELDGHAARAGVAPRGERVLDRFLAAPVVSWGSPVVGVARPRGDELAHEGIHVAGDWVGSSLLADAALGSGAVAGRAAARRHATVV